MLPEYQCLEIKGELLSSAYSVYVVEITNHSSNYYYVGQTGDAKVISARSPFYRLAAHLGYSKSTQNQIYRGLQSKLGLSNREEMEKWFFTSTLKMHYFKISDFTFLDALNESHLASHHTLRRKTLIYETALIRELKAIHSENVLNLSEVTYKIADPSSNAFVQNVFLKLGLSS
jgi:hypothetical protein